MVNSLHIDQHSKTISQACEVLADGKVDRDAVFVTLALRSV